MVESYHPNRPGHASGYAPVVGSKHTGATVTAAVTNSTTTLRLAEASADELTAQQRPNRAKDRTITRKEFRAPDLTSPKVKAAAARAGVDLTSRASIDAADRRDDELQNAQLQRPR